MQLDDTARTRLESDLGFLASELCKRFALIVRIRPPAIKILLGQAFKTRPSGGLAVIDVAPGLELADFWHIYLHECAHVLLEHSDLAIMALDTPSGSIEVSKRFSVTSYRATPSETQADKLARRWYDLGEKFAPYYSGGWLQSRIAALKKHHL